MPAPVIAQETPRVVEAPKPQVLPGQLATVEAVREVKEPGDAKGVGRGGRRRGGRRTRQQARQGQRPGHHPRRGGRRAHGHQVEKQVRAEKRWEIALRLDDGSQRTLSSEAQPAWRAGNRVGIVDDKLQPA